MVDFWLENMKQIISIAVLVSILAACDFRNGNQDSPADSVVAKVDTLGVIDSVQAENERFFLNEHEHRIYTDPEQPATFPGGMEEMQAFFEEEVVFPSSGSGTVVVSFVIDEDGNVDNVQLISPLEDKLLNTEAMRAIRNMPQWSPAEDQGKPVKSQYILPVSFDNAS